MSQSAVMRALALYLKDDGTFSVAHVSIRCDAGTRLIFTSHNILFCVAISMCDLRLIDFATTKIGVVIEIGEKYLKFINPTNPLCNI